MCLSTSRGGSVTATKDHVKKFRSELTASFSGIINYKMNALKNTE